MLLYISIHWFNLALIAITFFILLQMESNHSFWEKARNSWLFVPCLLIAFLIVVLLYLDIRADMFSKDGLKSILSEAHGLLFDLLFVIIGIGIYDKIRGRREEKNQLFEELDDFKYWKGEESTFRRVGIIKRLLRAGVQKILLKDHIFKEANFTGIDLNKLSLSGDEFIKCEFRNSSFSTYHIKRTDFRECIFNKINFNKDVAACEFIKSNFINCEFNTINMGSEEFEGCWFRGCQFSKCDLSFANFKKTHFNGNISFSGSTIRDIELDGCVFGDLRRDELIVKLQDWFGEPATQQHILDKYYITNFDDPLPWDHTGMELIGQRKSYKVKQPGCFFTKKIANPYATAD